MPEIRCSVANCTHWGQGNFCQASSIIVHGDTTSYEEAASQSFQSALLNGDFHDAASTSTETCCKTFEPRY